MDRRIIADTSGIIAFLDRDDHYHSPVVDVIKTHQIYIPVTVLPEVDYLATKYLGERVARSFLEDLADGYFNYLPIELDDINKATKIMERYKDLPLGLVDASLIILAERHKMRKILTLDRRHFNLIKSEYINYLELFPWKKLETKRKNSNADTRKLEREIDEVVYELYGLNEEEIAIIEESIRK